MKNNFGVIDIGSNSVRMVIYDLTQTPPVQIYNEKFFCALGRDLTKTGKLNPDGTAIALDGLKVYAQVAHDHNLANLDIVGTAALRDASDGQDFIDCAKAETGLTIRLITGHEEARYAALGVFSLDPAAEGLVADFGGGSLEFANIRAGQIHETVSKPFGAFRALAMEDKAADLITAGLQGLVAQYGNAPALYSIGGSWRALSQAYMIDCGTHTPLQGYSIPNDEMVRFCDKMIGLTPDDVRRLYKIEDKRSTLAPISAFVLKQVMLVLRPQKLVVSLAGIRDGIVYDFYNR